MREEDLVQVLSMLPRPTDPRLIVGSDTRDDAAVVRLGPDLAVATSTDFFTPVVDDAYQWGAIAAANGLSDIYAMGATPIVALNILCWPAKNEDLGPEVLAAVLRGGSDKCAEAGIAIGGGHSVEDAEPKYGLAVVGVVKPDEIWTNVGAAPGDVLVLTKPLGSGIVTTGLKRRVATPDEVSRAVAIMIELNDVAASCIKSLGGAHAVTDVTGFGLLGHLREMFARGQVRARITAGSVPVLAGARRLASEGVFPGGTRANLRAASGEVVFDDSIDEARRLILADAQTSGGLLAALPTEAGRALLEELRSEGIENATIIGEVVAGPPGVDVLP